MEPATKSLALAFAALVAVATTCTMPAVAQNVVILDCKSVTTPSSWSNEIIAIDFDKGIAQHLFTNGERERNPRVLANIRGETVSFDYPVGMGLTYRWQINRFTGRASVELVPPSHSSVGTDRGTLNCVPRDGLPVPTRRF